MRGSTPISHVPSIRSSSSKVPKAPSWGSGSLSKFHQRAGYDGIAELSYYIAGDHQRQGLGTMMVRWLIDAAAERGFTHVTAIIYADNAGSVALMRRFGFIRFGLLPAAVGALDGKLHDMSYWVKAWRVGYNP